MGKSVAAASDSVMSNTLKPLTNTQTVFVVDLHQTMIMSVHFENGRSAHREYLNCCSQVLKRSVRTKYVRTMTSNCRSTLTNLTRNFDAGECKLIFDNQHNGTKDNNNNNNTVMLDEREAAYRSEDASNSFTFMIIMVIIPCTFTTYLVDYHLYLFLFVLH